MTPGTVMDGLRRGQRGSALALALVVMLFLGVLIAGLIPMLNQELKAAQLDRDILETRYVAEAGVKHALRVLADPTFKANRSVFTETNSFAGNANKTYSVTILRPDGTRLPPNESLADGTTYTIVSVGTITNASGGPTWTARDTYTTAVQNNAYKYGILSQGTLTVYSGTYTNSVNGQQYAIASVAATPGFNWGPTVTTGVTGVNLDILPASFFSITNAIYSGYTAKTMNTTMNPSMASGSSWSNLWGTITFPAGNSLYEVAGNVATNTTSLTTGSTNYVAIYSHGNIDINANLNGNFIFMADGYINLNAKSHTGTIKLYAKGPLTINAPISGYSVLMTRDALTVNADSFVKSFMFGRSSVTLNVSGPITGAVYSYGWMTINSSTVFTYDPSVIP